MSLVVLLLIVDPARAEPASPPGAPWWIGLPLAQVQLSAPEGGLPEETLEPLLRVEEGEPLDPHEVGLDLATLFQVGEFSAVQADVEPWVGYDEATGEPVPGALLTYVVFPAPKIARVAVQGNKNFRDRDLLEAIGLAPGQVFYADLDGSFSKTRLERWLYRQGYTRPTVQIRSTEPEPGQIHVVVDVDEGQPNTLERLTFTGDLEGVATERELRRWARRARTDGVDAGVVEGAPLAPDAIVRAQEAIRERLGSVRGGWFGRARGYVSARVTPVVVDSPEGARVSYAIEPGPRLELEVTGLGPSGRGRVEQVLGIDHRLRVTRGFLDQAPDRLVASLQERGWLEATATVTEERPSDMLQRLVVDVDLGRKHTIGERPSRAFVDFAFTFVDPIGSAGDARREEKELQAVFDQGSPEILRRDFYTAAAMRAGTEAAKQYYVDRGFLDANLTVEVPEIRERPTPGNLWRKAAGFAPQMRITPNVRIERGPVTMLDALEVTGAAPGIDLSFVDRAREERVDQPFSPQQLELLARRVGEAHREAGYLEVDLRIQQTETGPQRRSARIVVEPGTRVLLRSVVTRGTRLTKAAFIQNEVDLDLGQPVTSAALEDVRSRLYELGIFQSVSLTLIGDEEARDLVVSLDERKRWGLEAGGGVSTDQGYRAYGRLTRRNLFGTAQRLELFGQAGFEYRSDDIRDWLPDFTNPEWRAAVSYTAPRFPTRNQELILDLVLRERRQERTWRMDRTGGGVAIETRLDRTRLRFGARLETRQLNEVDAGALLEGEPWAEMLGLPNPDLTRPPWRVQESLVGLLIHDLRDNPLQPRKGALLSANVEWAPGFPWDEIRDQPRTAFLKSEARISVYIPLSGLTLHVAAGGGHIASFAGPVPLEDRFRLGGTGSLRGFVRDAVGPQNITPPLRVDWPTGIGPAIDYALRDNPERWTPTGGDTNAVGTVELLMPLPALGFASWEGYAGEFFADVGNAWFLDPDATPESENRDVPFLRFGVGAGMRIDTPIGPLQLDFAVNPQAAAAQGARRVLLIDGWREPVARLHLTLGALW